MGIGDWGLGIGDLGIGDWANPQSPIPIFFLLIIKLFYKNRRIYDNPNQ
jgi:hypothetical protein